MKKIIVAVLALCLCIGVICVQQKQVLPIPEYPLSIKAVNDELKRLGLNCDVREERSRFPESTLYNFTNIGDGKYVVGIGSAQKEGERSLSIVFPRYFTVNAVPVKACEDWIALATTLFGGFKNTHQVHDRFIRDYRNQNNIEKETLKINERTAFPQQEGETRWVSEVGGITCTIIVAQPKLNEPHAYLDRLLFVSNSDTFSAS